MWRPKVIHSGGQTGVDRAALDVAMKYSIEHGGWCPRGRICENGVIPPLYRLKETPSSQIIQRTEWNVRDTDGTLVLFSGPFAEITDGTIDTIDFCSKYRRPLLKVDLSVGKVELVVDWGMKHSIVKLNVAGPREGPVENIYNESYKFLCSVFSKM